MHYDPNLINKIKEKDIIVFGAGMAGQGVVKILKSYSIKPICFFDNRANNAYKMMDISVVKLPLEHYGDERFLFVLAVHDMDEAIRQLQKLGINSYIPAYFLLNENVNISFMEYQKIEAIYYYYERYLQSSDLRLHTLDFVITERCSLKCRDCSNLMQYYTNPRNYSLDEMEESISRLMNVIDEIYELRLIGGEPFINPQWPQILEIIKRYENIIRVSIYTNGTIIPTDAQCRLLKQFGVWLSISDYGDLSKIKKLTGKLNYYAVPYEVKSIPFWTKCAEIVKRNRTISENKLIFERCCARNLVTVIDNKLYGCPFIANAMNLRAIPVCEKDFVDLENDNINDVKRRMKELWQRPYYKSCDFCQGRPIAEDINDDDKIPPHEQIKLPLEYVKY
ncbi:radical SAM protein [Selenomonas ruminantium]|uniref:4Fe-4S single cluster domain-containing protein n=1 Tax=Selenomonas ruminantium TaxID=971 RepID=A0A1I0YH68_SELRU|nr:radical SAM protein [Selenomonas ruminantium]SFB12086.1 4Fe-4S single cluster domain-containing protein [Selenomonas ruminantium]